MLKRIPAASGVAAMVVILLAAGQSPAQDHPTSYAAVPGLKGGTEVFGPYDVQVGWPKNIADELPDHEAWTYGAGQSIYAESPNRIIGLMRGELPQLDPPRPVRLTEVGPSITFPHGRGYVFFRDATVVSMPGNGGPGADPATAMEAWERAGGRAGIDARWEHCIVVFDGEGNIIETWDQWDDMLQRPHQVTMNSYDPEKHVWIIDDHKHAIFEFTNDGSRLVQTIGTYGEPGDDETHFNRPTYMDFFAEGGFVVADGYNGTRVVRFDKDGNYMLEWGHAGKNGGETRPGYWYNLHGMAIDPQTNHVFVYDRGNSRVQVFTADGEYLYEWSFGGDPTDVHTIHINSDGYLWAVDRVTNKFLKYTLDGELLYSWGVWGAFPGGIWGVHDFSFDQDGNVYTAEVHRGGFQKFTPRPGANPDFLMGKPRRVAWK